MDQSRSLALITRVGATLTGVGSCITPFTEIFDKLEGLFSKVAPAEMAPAIALAVVLLTLIGSILVAWLSFRKVSRLDRSQKDAFDLRARTADDLIGRDDDITDFMALIETNQLVFLVGDSGSGKSALVATGLKPRLQKGDQFLPILITRYGTDWVAGPTIEALKVLREACTPEQQRAVEWTQPHKLSDATPAFLLQKLRAISTALNRTPVLMFDQFDDYQAQHRSLFSREHRRWISADELRATNPFWDVIAKAIDDGCQVLIVTRRDTADGLHAVRFVNNAAQRPLDWVGGNRLDELLERIAPSTATPPVVVDPEHGWVQLWPLLAQDMYRDGAFLPQQVRTVLLGLRTLPALTPQLYRSAGAAAGMGALYVSDAISSISRVTKLPPPAIRKLLLGMVDHGPDGRELKTRRMTETEIKVLFPDPAQIKTVLEALAERELVRAVPNADTGENDWQLDHDYLARAVVAEERIKERQAVLLREGAAALAQAVGDWRQQWRALLPVAQWPGLLFSRLRGDFRFGPYRRYAVISLLRTVPALNIVLVIVVTSVITTDELRQRNEAAAIFDLLRKDGNTGEGAQANLQLWAAPEPVRHRVETMLLSSSRLKDVSSTWVLAVAGANPSEVKRLAGAILERSSSSKNPDERQALWETLSTLAPRLDPATANRSLSVVLQYLPPSPNRERMAILSYLDSIAHNLDPDAAKRVVSAMVRTTQEVDDVNIRRIARGLNPDAARAVAAWSVSLLTNEEERVLWLAILRDVGGNAAPDVAMEAVPQVGQALRSGKLSAERAAAALLTISNHETPEVASAAVRELSDQFARFTDHKQRDIIVNVLNTHGSSTTPQLGMAMVPLLARHLNAVSGTQESKSVLGLLATLADHSDAQVGEVARRVLRQHSAKVATLENAIDLIEIIPQAIRFLKPELAKSASQKIVTPFFEGGGGIGLLMRLTDEYYLVKYYIETSAPIKSKELAIYLIDELKYSNINYFKRTTIFCIGYALNRQKKEDFEYIIDYFLKKIGESLSVDAQYSYRSTISPESIKSLGESLDAEHAINAVQYLNSQFKVAEDPAKKNAVASLMSAFVERVEMNIADDTIKSLLSHMANTSDIDNRVRIANLVGIFASRVGPGTLMAMEGVLRKSLEAAKDPGERMAMAKALGTVARRLPFDAADSVALALRKHLTDDKNAAERQVLHHALVDTTEVRARTPAGQVGVVKDLLLVLSDPFASEGVYRRLFKVIGSLPDVAAPADWPSAVAALQKLGGNPAGGHIALAGASRH